MEEQRIEHEKSSVLVPAARKIDVEVACFAVKYPGVAQPKIIGPPKVLQWI